MTVVTFNAIEARDNGHMRDAVDGVLREYTPQKGYPPSRVLDSFVLARALDRMVAGLLTRQGYISNVPLIVYQAEDLEEEIARRRTGGLPPVPAELRDCHYLPQLGVVVSHHPTTRARRALIFPPTKCRPRGPGQITFDPEPPLPDPGLGVVDRFEFVVGAFPSPRLGADLPYQGFCDLTMVLGPGISGDLWNLDAYIHVGFPYDRWDDLAACFHIDVDPQSPPPDLDGFQVGEISRITFALEDLAASFRLMTHERISEL